MYSLKSQVALLVVFFMMGCGGGQQEVEAPSSSEARPPPEAPVEEAMTAALHRQDMLAVLGRSVGDFLRRVHVEVETDEDGYVGWRITHLPETTPTWLDIRTGDVVTSVNGLPIEQPNEAQQVFELLQVASEVRIELIRDGERRALRIPVEDSDGAAATEGDAGDVEPRGPEPKSS